MGTANESLRADLLRLELAIARRRVADLPGGTYEAALDEAFREIGASGRWWTREAMLAALAAAEPVDVPIERFEIEELAPGVVLATYRTAGDRPAQRASIWVENGGQWRLKFHQGTLLV
jgi:ribonuclease HI